MNKRLLTAVFLFFAFILAPIWQTASGAAIKDTESSDSWG